jgi:hypothetical protein
MYCAQAGELASSRAAKAVAAASRLRRLLDYVIFFSIVLLF